MGVLDNPFFQAGQQLGGAIAGGMQSYQQAKTERLQHVAQMAIARFNAGDHAGAHALAQTMNGALGLAGPKLNHGQLAAQGPTEDGTSLAPVDTGVDWSNAANTRAVAGELGITAPAEQLVKYGDGGLLRYVPGYSGQPGTMTSVVEPQQKPLVLGEGAIAVDRTTGKTLAQGNPKTFAPQKPPAQHFHTHTDESGHMYLVPDAAGADLGVDPAARRAKESQHQSWEQGKLNFVKSREDTYRRDHSKKDRHGNIISSPPQAEIDAAGALADKEYQNRVPDPLAKPVYPTPDGQPPAAAPAAPARKSPFGRPAGASATPAAYHPGGLLGQHVASKAVLQWMPQIEAASQETGMPVDLIAAVMDQESGGNATARSPVGALGLMQLMPGTAKGLGVDPSDPADNIRGGALYLAQQIRAFGGDVEKALAAYNAGPGAVAKYKGVPPYAETKAYVNSIMQRLRATQRRQGNPVRTTEAPTDERLAALYERYGVQPGASQDLLDA